MPAPSSTLPICPRTAQPVSRSADFSISTPTAPARWRNRHGVPTVYASLDELLADPGVRVVDIAVAPQAQSEIALRAREAGKHLLCQKPFVWEEATGEKLVAVADRLGLKIAVNQQLRYDEGLAAARAMVRATHENRAGDTQALFRIDGSHGSIRGTLGLLYDYPNGRPDTGRGQQPGLADGRLAYPVTHRWIPDAFLGPMASLLRAVAEDGEPYPSARDNLGTIRLVDRLYSSMDSGRSMPMGR
ncbi:Gfo/Idh/MocA family oxidoreductase [Streptomyces tubercidicus]|nr:Gfo/Idh/MocA family oxidoreductase [Streptomyces tubercidicus]